MSNTVNLPSPEQLGIKSGPHVFGFLLNFTLLGALSVQFFNYTLNSSNDRSLIKMTVWTVMILEYLQSGLMAYDAFILYGEGFGDLVVFDTNHTDWLSVCIVGGITAGIVQIFYAARLWKFSNSKVLTGAVLLLASTQIVVGIVQGVRSKLAVKFSNLGPTIATLLLWIISGAVCDIVIAFGMTWYLRKSRTGFQQTDKTISRLVAYTVETGLVTAIFAIMLVALFVGVPGKDYFEVCAKGLAKIYSNQLLLVLNSRKLIQQGHHSTLKSIGHNGVRSLTDPSLTLPHPQSPNLNEEYKLSQIPDSGTPRQLSFGDARSNGVHITTSRQVWAETPGMDQSAAKSGFV